MVRILTKSIPGLLEFQNYCTQTLKLKKGTAQDYCTWIKRLPKRVIVPTFFNDVAWYIINGKKDELTQFIDGQIDNYIAYVDERNSTPLLSNTWSALCCYRKFALTMPTLVCSNLKKPQKVRGYLSNINQLDGMDSLIASMSGATQNDREADFVKKAIAGSYFFCCGDVLNRFNKISNAIQNGTRLPARESLKNTSNVDGWQCNNIYYDYNGNFSSPIIIDGNGNANVCSVINDYVGYNLALGNGKKPFINIVISHIWGKTSDPRYFTNLWNIVLVPAWANHLLDKNPKPGSTAAKFKATMMAVCEQQYGMSCLSWNGLKMTQPQISNRNDVIHGDYNINVISGKGSNKLGCITIQTIHV